MSVLLSLYNFITELKIKHEVRKASLELIEARKKSTEVTLNNMDRRIAEIENDIEYRQSTDHISELPGYEAILANDHYVASQYKAIDSLVAFKNSIIDAELMYQHEMVKKIHQPTKE